MSRTMRPAALPRTSQKTPAGFDHVAPLIALGAILCVAVGFGGGGMRYALFNLSVQLTALVVVAFRRDAVVQFWGSAPVLLRVLVVLTILLPLSHLIPLPENIWSSLPGRELVQQSFALTGKSGWAPASVDPLRTLVAMTGLIVPLAILTAGWTIPRAQLLLLGWLVVILALAIFLIGIPQVLSNGNSNVLTGTFANRNSTGVFLVGALALAAVLPSPREHPPALPVRLGICAVLIIGVVLTRSRTALVLTLIPLALAALKALWWAKRRHNGHLAVMRHSKLIAAGIIVLGLGAVAATVIVAPGRIGDTIERFEATDDARRYIWEDGAYSASRYWPVGAGMGAFDEVFQVDESLENATQRRAGRAHNDYLEVAIEAGLPGLVLIAMWLAMIALLTWRARQSDLRWSAWGAAAILLAIALQSITDYPLRSQALLAIASFALLLLVRLRPAREKALQ